MKRFLILICLALMLAGGAKAQVDTYSNTGTNYYGPAGIPQIDATNFINLGEFVVDISTPLPFSFSDVLNYTNRNYMECNNGFLFNTQPSNVGSAHRARLFGNSGIIEANGNTFVGTNIFFFNLPVGFFSGQYPATTISATNIVNAGTVGVGVNGLLTLDGETIKVPRGTLDIEGFQDFGLSFGFGMFDNYWGLGLQTNTIQQGNYTLPNPRIPSYAVFNTLYQNTIVTLNMANAFAKANITQLNASNTLTQIVFVGNNNSNVLADARFIPEFNGGNPIVEYKAYVTNAFGQITTNAIYITDSFGTTTNFQLVTNLFTASTLTPQLLPFNYDIEAFFNGDFGAIPQGNTPYDPSLIPRGSGITNQYTAFGIDVEPVTFRPNPDVPGQTLTNIPGRLVINADKFLDLNNSIINGPNYLKIAATNHYNGSTNALITSPNLDLNLGSTNGTLNVINLVQPFLPRFVGTIDGYSARWTNVVDGFTNTYHIFLVDANLSPTALPLVQNLRLRSTNVVISDVINIATNLLINAQTLTIGTNTSDSPNPYGELNLKSPLIIWSASLPVLQCFTNYGILTAPNSVYFYESAQPPYYTSNFTASYQAFVNHGSIVTSGNTTWADYFESTSVGLTFTNAGGLPITSNQSVIYSTFGPISIMASNAIMANDILETAIGDINISAGSLLATNHVMQVNGALNLTVTNQLTDGGIGSSNFWSVQNGFSLLGSAPPIQGDLLGTTVTNICPAGVETYNTWSGRDLGTNAAGFANNGAVGHLILDAGSSRSLFYFNGSDATNAHALYVDLLELKNYATNRSNLGGIQNFTSIGFDDNMTIYYADALISGFDVAEKLNGANGGHFVWVPTYAGIFSSTNVLYPSGQTYTFNRALVQSTDIDSDGDGVANAYDPTPVPIYSMNLSVTFTNMPQKTPLISLNALANTTYSIYYKSGMTGANWQLLTNLGPTSVNTNISFIDRGRTNSAGFYKVQTGAGQP